MHLGNRVKIFVPLDYDKGVVYIFTKRSEWVYSQTLIGGNQRNFFGASVVDIDETTLAVGASGCAYLFVLTDFGWTQNHVLTIDGWDGSSIAAEGFLAVTASRCELSHNYPSKQIKPFLH